MPVLDGMTTCERLRQFSYIPVIILTTKGEEEEDRVHGLNAGADDSIVKPFSATVMLGRIRKILRQALSTRQVIQ